MAPDDDGASSSKVGQFPQKIQLTANEALAKMLAIEKCDTVVMNPLFGSGLPYKTKVCCVILYRFGASYLCHLLLSCCVICECFDYIHELMIVFFHEDYFQFC